MFERVEKDMTTLEDKVKLAIERLQFYRDRKHEKTYLAFSGGKDSIVIYDLAKQSGIPIEPHNHFTTVDPPELVRFVKENYPEVIVDRPDCTKRHRGGELVSIKSMFQLIAFKGIAKALADQWSNL
jgi:3'-phosphoadenosine 5'-phosphosulfate sulfotransferase (PAPS reductase)/FAD synthetase